jgi:hypothetical protein
MRNILIILCLLILMGACKETEQKKITVEQLISKHQIPENTNFDILTHGKTYLPVYSHIYHGEQHNSFKLTITISIRNISTSDSVYIFKADYYNTLGEYIRHYLSQPICLSPLETVEIIIEEQDDEGGSGANFMFDWAMKNDKNPPLFEAVMISTYGQQGLSFTTRGIQVKK